MGRAIVRDPQVFLFDEPLSNLDAKLRVAMRTEIKALHQRLKTTTVYVTHDQVEAMTMADKIVVMHDGIVEQIGAPLDLYDRPANMFVAGFIGSPAMNSFPARAAAAAARALEAAAACARAAGRRAGHRRPAGADGTTARASRDRERRAAGRVVVVEPTGAETQVVCRSAAGRHAVFRERDHFEPGDQDHARAATPRARICSTLRPAPGSRMSHRDRPGEQLRGGTKNTREESMNDFKRRDPLKTGAGVAGGGALGGGPALPRAAGRAQQLSITPEHGAQLRVLRWSRFVQGDEGAWLANTQRFTQTTGVQVRLDDEGWEDIRPKAAVAANVGAGPDIIFGWMDDPHCIPTSWSTSPTSPTISATSTAAGTTREGATACATIGGSLPLGAAGNAIVYRKPRQRGGLRQIPARPRRLPASCARR